MKKILCFSICISVVYLLWPLKSVAQINQQSNSALAKRILSDSSLDRVDAMGRELLTKQFNAGDGYSQIWLRDLNTFIDIALEVRKADDIKGVLKTFLEFQQSNNEIVDCYGPKEKKWGDTNLYYSNCNSKYVGFKATVETHQETSLIQAVAKYVHKTKDYSFLSEKFVV